MAPLRRCEIQYQLEVFDAKTRHAHAFVLFLAALVVTDAWCSIGCLAVPVRLPPFVEMSSVHVGAIVSGVRCLLTQQMITRVQTSGCWV
jgi:hypothetical protein